MKVNKFWALLVLSTSICSCFLYRPDPSSAQSDEIRALPYFVSIPLTFSSTGMPFLDVRIGEKTYPMKLDLGFRGDLSISEKYCRELADKKFLRSKSMYGFRGNEHKVSLYTIDKASIASVNFSRPKLQEWSEEACNASIVLRDASMAVVPDGAGLVGWELFRHAKLLLDLKNQKIIVVDSLDTLANHGYSPCDFIRTPLYLDRGLVEIDVLASGEVLRCVLDTASTLNILNVDSGDKSLEEMIWDSSSAIELTSFQIDHQEFGPVSVLQVPVRIPVHVEAILGVDFFQNHLVLLDFDGGCAYFSKYKYTENDSRIGF